MRIQNLRPGDQFQDHFVVRGRVERQTRGTPKKTYLALTLANAECDFSFNVWTESMHLWAGHEIGAAVFVSGRVDPPKNGFQNYTIQHVEAAPDHPVRLCINPMYDGDLSVLRERLDARIADIRSRRPGLADIVQRILDHAGMDAFCTAPGAIFHHHNYIGGLLDHTLEVEGIARATAEQPSFVKHVDVDLLSAGALIHDIGKVDVYVWDGVPIGMSKTGLLASHITLGALRLEKATFALRLEQVDVDDNDIMLLRHLIESHHGKAEYGSPVDPATPEAIILHTADMASFHSRALLQEILQGTKQEDGVVVQQRGRARYYSGNPEMDGPETQEQETDDVMSPTLAGGVGSQGLLRL